MEFEFNLDRVDLVAPALDEQAGAPVEPPEDLYEVIGTEGDRYRDWFTRACLYVVGQSLAGARDPDGDVVVIGTEYGNTAALLGLKREATAKGKLLSPQYFPSATSSSAAAFLSMRIGATGGNFTINAGLLTPIVALWQALCGLRYRRGAGSRLLVGDVYSREVLADAEKDTPDLACESGLAHARFTAGTEFGARFRFDPPGPADAAGAAPRGGTRLHGPVRASSEHYGRNGAFAVADLLNAARSLPAGASVGLECRTRQDLRGEVRITRHGDSALDTRRSTE